jgi:orotate phosphoribosyltransferase
MENLRKALIDKAVRSASNTTNGVIYDLFKATGNGPALAEAGKALADKVPADVTVLVAPGLGAAGLAAAVALMSVRPLTIISVRDAKKARDTERLVEGPVPTEPANAMFIDDTITNGTTYLDTCATLATAAPHIKITCVGLLLDAWHPHGSRTIHASGTPVVSVFRRHDLNVTRDDVSMAAGGPRVPALAEMVLKTRVAECDVERYKSSVLMTETAIITADDTHVIRAHDYDGNLLWHWQSDNPRPKGIVQDFVLHPFGLVMGSYDGTIMQISIADGKVAWRTKLSQAIHGTPVVDNDGTIYVAVEEWDTIAKKPGGSIVKLAADGTVIARRRYSEDFAPCTCAVLEEAVVMAANDKVVQCFDKDIQVQRWTYTTEGMVRGAIGQFNGNVFFADEAGWAYSLHTDMGTCIWRRKLARAFNSAVPVFITSTVDDVQRQLVVLCDAGGFAHALDTGTGERVWLTRFRSRVGWRPTLLADGRLLFAGAEGDINIVNPATGVKEAQNRTERAFLQPGGTWAGKYGNITSNGTLIVWNLV